MCLNVGKGKISLEELKLTMDEKMPLEQAWSVPASGLFLTDIKYKFIE
jgi:tRNA U38,U39,U40 pseudouridine synthase TruA